MLKSMINPDLSGKKTKLTLGIMLIMLLALSTNLMAGTYSGGSGDPVGTDEGPYQISNTDDLIELSNTSGDWGAYFIQTTDFAFDSDETEVDWNNSGSPGPTEGFSPIGTYSNDPFSGSYDGGGYTIDNLYIDRSSSNIIGLFGYTEGATITDIGITNVYITGYWNVAGLMAYNNNSTVNNCYSTGSVSGSGWRVGGLGGKFYASSTISNSYSNVSVTGGTQRTGGLVGVNDGSSISNSYSTGSVTSSGDYVGGLVGYNDDGTISQCYATGLVSGTANIGGLVGLNESGDVNNSFWDTETSEQSSSDGGTSKDTDEMKTENFSGWDWTSTWERIGYNYPRLINNPDPTLPVTLSTFTALYTEGATQLSWVTQSEEDNVGWNVYRANSNDYSSSEQINGSLIEGNGTTAEPSYYSFADESELTIGQTYYYWLESIDLGGENHIYNTVVNITIPEPGNDPNLELPTLYEIGTAPNPMQDNTTFRLTMDKTAQVKIEIYNIKGELVKTLPSIIVEADAEQDLYWNGKDSNNGEVGSGLYFYKVKANGKTIENNKLIIMK